MSDVLVLLPALRRAAAGFPRRWREDLVQDGLVAALQFPWLSLGYRLTAARHRMIDVARRERLRTCAPLPIGDPPSHRQRERAELPPRVIAGLRRLSPRQRLVLAAWAWGHSSSRIARHVGVSPAHANSIKDRSIRRLGGGLSA